MTTFERWVEALLVLSATVAILAMLLSEDAESILKFGFGALFALGLAQSLQRERS